ncbi:biliverdin-producing heme oxygenase [Curtobacterium sp. Csp2]|uniref:biliverdin-producing heme oxygenase n=1 Tax=Curtobacterium sp. Csp2 TaxID=2495430 RepID=UPI001580E9AE|nr:biliverdin-producing heme oxygenase [Curtobacterium sp. Csp2]QKS16716.1 biliverdin-producing heme oxygenase [Curtobacterium sp. Csp2]
MGATVTTFSELLRRRAGRSDAAASGAAASGAQGLFAGECDVADYADLLGQYAHVYAALERAAERMADHPVAAPFVTNQLTRLPAITADLEYLVGPDWSELCCPTAATTAYVRRLNEVAATSPGGFVAHHYTRYLGDLTGGPTLAALLEERFGFDTNGVLFTIFDQVADPAAFQATYRAELDAAPWTDAERDAVLAEVETAAALDRAVLRSIGHGLPAATA